jgi:hypothetical protein
MLINDGDHTLAERIVKIKVFGNLPWNGMARRGARRNIFTGIAKDLILG